MYKFILKNTKPYGERVALHFKNKEDYVKYKEEIIEYAKELNYTYSHSCCGNLGLVFNTQKYRC